MFHWRKIGTIPVVMLLLMGGISNLAYVSESQASNVLIFSQAAEEGDAGAQFMLGVIYSSGDGVPRDDKQASYWFGKAAEQGDAEAQYQLGMMYANGKGVPQDYTQAEHWYRKAAAQGHAMAKNDLAALPSTVQNTPPKGNIINETLKAAEQGDAEVKNELAALPSTVQNTPPKGDVHNLVLKIAEQRAVVQKARKIFDEQRDGDFILMLSETESDSGKQFAKEIETLKKLEKELESLCNNAKNSSLQACVDFAYEKKRRPSNRKIYPRKLDKMSEEESLIAALDNFIEISSDEWKKHKYNKGSVKNLEVLERRQVISVYAEYTYQVYNDGRSTNHEGWVKAILQDDDLSDLWRLECLAFEDSKKRCGGALNYSCFINGLDINGGLGVVCEWVDVECDMFGSCKQIKYNRPFF